MGACKETAARCCCCNVMPWLELITVRAARRVSQSDAVRAARINCLIWNGRYSIFVYYITRYSRPHPITSTDMSSSCNTLYVAEATTEREKSKQTGFCLFGFHHLRRPSSSTSSSSSTSFNPTQRYSINTTRYCPSLSLRAL